MQPAVVDPYAQPQQQQPQPGYGGAPVAAMAAYPSNGYGQHGGGAGAYAQPTAGGYAQNVGEYDATGQYQQDYR